MCCCLGLIIQIQIQGLKQQVESGLFLPTLHPVFEFLLRNNLALFHLFLSKFYIRLEPSMHGLPTYICNQPGVSYKCHPIWKHEKEFNTGNFMDKKQLIS